VPICDGCGFAVDDAHIRQRIQRLELATRFRPIHINVLLIDANPPADPSDFFYASASSQASAAQNPYFRELAKLAAGGSDLAPESVLSEFQRRGFFVTSAVECPMPSGDDLSAAIRRLAPTVRRRVQASYKPKYVVLVSQPTSELIEPLRACGWGDRLILDNGCPFDVVSHEGQNRAGPAESLGDRLLATISRLAQSGC
jgi:hypothetical protein